MTIPIGATAGTISVTVKGDTAVEDDEAFAVRLTGVTPATTSLGTAVAVGITNDDEAALISIGDQQRLEGHRGRATFAFAVTLDRPAPASIKVGYTTVDDSAAAPGDFVAKSGTLTFAAGASSATIPVKVTGDALEEPDERFTVQLTGVTRDRARSPTTWVRLIVNDDVTAVADIADALVVEGTTGEDDVVRRAAGPTDHRGGEDRLHDRRRVGRCAG